MALEHQGSVPVPDPTKLTTDAVNSAKIDIEKLFDVKLNGLKELITEKFAGRDTALAAALKAAQELVKQQNDSNTIANDKMEKSFATQITNLETRIADLKDTVAGLGAKNYAAIGAYIFGGVGIVSLIVSLIVTAFWHHA